MSEFLSSPVSLHDLLCLLLSCPTVSISQFLLSLPTLECVNFLGFSPEPSASLFPHPLPLGSPTSAAFRLLREKPPPPDPGPRLNLLLAPAIFQVLAGVGPELKSLFSSVRLMAGLSPETIGIQHRAQRGQALSTNKSE